jgi:hypothetical protein
MLSSGIDDRPYGPAFPADEEARADAEERTQQDEIRKIRQVDDVRAEPADQRQFEEEHEAACQQQSNDRVRSTPLASAMTRDEQRQPAKW